MRRSFVASYFCLRSEPNILKVLALVAACAENCNVREVDEVAAVQLSGASLTLASLARYERRYAGAIAHIANTRVANKLAAAHWQEGLQDLTSTLQRVANTSGSATEDSEVYLNLVRQLRGARKEVRESHLEDVALLKSLENEFYVCDHRRHEQLEHITTGTHRQAAFLDHAKTLRTCKGKDRWPWPSDWANYSESSSLRIRWVQKNMQILRSLPCNCNYSWC